MRIQPTINVVVGIAVACMVAAAGVASAETIFMSITAQKQGVLRGDMTKTVPEGKISALKFRYEVLSPTDLASGMATGRRQHRPVVITKAWSAASPQLFQALVSNETLSEVLIDFVAADASGIMVLNHRVRLVNAKVIDISHSTEVPADVANRSLMRQLEDVSFSFQRIEFEDTASRIAAIDDKSAP